jgi:hypothetical protein
MGNYSLLRRILHSPEKCIIDWNKADTRKLYAHYLLEDIHKNQRASNLAEVADIWSDTKLCGYLTIDYITAIQELCKCLIPYGEFPRLYYDYEGFDMLCCFVFFPGTETVMYGTIDYSNELAKENIPPHPETVFTNGEIPSEEEYEKWDNARERVFDRIIQSGIWKFQNLSDLYVDMNKYSFLNYY